MDYKKKYEEAMLRMNKWVEGSEIIDPKEVAEFVFPELKESEDMGKRLIKSIEGSAQFTYCLQKHGFIKEDVISWLEKQGEKSKPYSGISFKYNGHIWGMCARDNGVDILLDSQFLKHFEMLGEQKEINLVEILKHYPKETELYSPLYGKLWLAEVNEEHGIITCYRYPLEEGCTRAILKQEDTVSFYSNGTTGLPDFSVSKDCMLFLYDSEKQGEQKPNFCHHEVDLSDCSEEYRKAYYDGWNNCNQQHAQLEAEQKPAWSEEDEKKIELLIAFLKVNHPNGQFKVNPIDTPNMEVMSTEEIVDWLKSLKERMKGE